VNGLVWYVDTSAFLKLVIDEESSKAMRDWSLRHDSLWSSHLLRTEALRAAQRLDVGMRIIEEALERLSHGQVARADAKIVVDQEHLRSDQAVRIEAALPRLHEQALPDGSAGLLLRDFLGAAVETEPAHAEPDGTGGHHDNLDALPMQGGELRADRGDAGLIELADARGEHTRAELDYDAPTGEGWFGTLHRGWRV